jgi:hypothetical protein
MRIIDTQITLLDIRIIIEVQPMHSGFAWKDSLGGVMVRKRIVIKIDELAKEGSIELESMVSELTGETTTAGSESVKPAPRSRRFTASGKATEN